MKRIFAGLICGVVAVSGLMAGGCADQTKQELAACKQDLAACQKERDELARRNADLRDASANLDKLKEDALARDAQLGDLNRQLREAKEALAKAGKPGPGPKNPTGTAAGWTPTAMGDKVTVGSDLLFKPGKDTLSTEGEKELSKLAKDLKGTYAKVQTILIMGHTDSDPIKKSKWDDNWELSANRALEVARFLVKQGVDPKRLEPVAMGEYHPEDAGKGKAAKSKNRRVEIVVVK